MKWIGVLPWIYEPYYKKCVDTMHPEFRKHVLEIDNTKVNLGIMVSHNLGIQKMREENADWLVVLSAAIRFGSEGGLDFIEQLDPESINISAANKKTWAEDKQVGIYGQHCMAFNKECFDRAGIFDENFGLYGYEDLDFFIRLQKAFPDPEYSRRTKKVAIDAHDTTMAHALNLGGLKISEKENQASINYIEKKWGVILHGEMKNNNLSEHYDHPFNDSDKPLSWWPKPPDPRAVDHPYWRNL